MARHCAFGAVPLRSDSSNHRPDSSVLQTLESTEVMQTGHGLRQSRLGSWVKEAVSYRSPLETFSASDRHLCLLSGCSHPALTGGNR